jgi:hypothetical protein
MRVKSVGIYSYYTIAVVLNSLEAGTCSSIHCILNVFYDFDVLILRIKLKKIF